MTTAFGRIGFLDWADVQVVSAADGQLVARCDPGPDQLNHLGGVHAAVLFGLAEVAGAGAVTMTAMDAAAGAYTVVKDASIRYLAKAEGPITARAACATSPTTIAETLRSGRELVESVTAHLADEGGRAVAEVDFTIVIRPRR